MCTVYLIVSIDHVVSLVISETTHDQRRCTCLSFLFGRLSCAYGEPIEAGIGEVPPVGGGEVYTLAPTLFSSSHPMMPLSSHNIYVAPSVDEMATLIKVEPVFSW
jgi:hypothetical protein